MFITHIKAVIHMSYSYKGHMEREVAIYSGKKKPKPALEILITSPSYFKTVDEKKS